MICVLLKVCCIAPQSAVKKKITKLYKGIRETTFKKCFANHKKFFNVETYKNATRLPNKYWALQTNQLNPKVS